MNAPGPGQALRICSVPTLQPFYVHEFTASSDQHSTVLVSRLVHAIWKLCPYHTCHIRHISAYRCLFHSIFFFSVPHVLGARRKGPCIRNLPDICTVYKYLSGSHRLLVTTVHSLFFLPLLLLCRQPAELIHIPITRERIAKKIHLGGAHMVTWVLPYVLMYTRTCMEQGANQCQI